MTVEEKLNCIEEILMLNNIEDFSDGYHTFKQLYYQRMVLFATIVKQNKDKAWKSLRHEDGKLCFGGGWFVVGIDTPKGSYTYHYENNFYSLFDCEELERGKHWDGHTEKDVVRLLSLDGAMTVKEAIEKLIEIKKDALPVSECVIEDDDVAIKLAIEALEKQIPKKPIDLANSTYSKCPTCGGFHFDNYCANCGQKIDWSDEQ